MVPVVLEPSPVVVSVVASLVLPPPPLPVVSVLPVVVVSVPAVVPLLVLLVTAVPVAEVPVAGALAVVVPVVDDNVAPDALAALAVSCEPSLELQATSNAPASVGRLPRKVFILCFSPRVGSSRC